MVLRLRQEKKTRYTDLNIDFLPHPVTGDLTIVKDVESIKQGVKTLVLTKFYERPSNFGIGCQANALLFELPDLQTEEVISKTIFNVLHVFAPYAKDLNIKVQYNDELNSYNIDITFYPLNESKLESINFFLDRVR